MSLHVKVLNEPLVDTRRVPKRILYRQSALMWNVTASKQVNHPIWQLRLRDEKVRSEEREKAIRIIRKSDPDLNIALNYTTLMAALHLDVLHVLMHKRQWYPCNVQDPEGKPGCDWFGVNHYARSVNSAAVRHLIIHVTSDCWKHSLLSFCMEYSEVSFYSIQMQVSPNSVSHSNLT